MAFTRRRLAVGKRVTDRDLIKGYIRGDYTPDGLDQAAGEFFWLALTTRNTELGQLAGELWTEHGPGVLRRFKADDALPEHVQTMLHAHGFPPGDWSEQRAALEKTKDVFRRELVSIFNRRGGGQ